MGKVGLVSRALRRLLQLRLLEEDQSRLALESALAELHRLERALESAAERGRNSRELVRRAACTNDLPDRIAGLEEGRAALRQAVSLEGAICKSRLATDSLRENYQSARVERRQVETLLQEARAAADLDTTRRSQQALDNWFGSRCQAARSASGRSEREEES